MSDKEQRRLHFINSIVVSLEENPDWLHDALGAVSTGMNKAFQNAHARSSQYDLAFRCALALADPKRISQSTKDLLNAKISEIIGSNASKVEKDFLDRVGTSPFQNTGGDK